MASPVSSLTSYEIHFVTGSCIVVTGHLVSSAGCISRPWKQEYWSYMDQQSVVLMPHFNHHRWSMLCIGKKRLERAAIPENKDDSCISIAFSVPVKAFAFVPDSAGNHSGLASAISPSALCRYMSYNQRGFEFAQTNCHTDE